MNTAVEDLVLIGPRGLHARWAWVRGAVGVVLVLQASKRLGPCGVAVISGLRERGLAWMWLRLLAPGHRPWHGSPERIEVLGEGVLQALAWVRAQPGSAHSPVALFAERHGAQLACWLAVQHPQAFAAIASCHGHFDLSAAETRQLRTPLLMLATGLDAPVVRNNHLVRVALPRARLDVVHGASRSLTSLCERDEIAHRAAAWLHQQLREAGRATRT
ncbi:MAG: hypothetical protein RL227_1146 [Pseudomonadota bacterium]|jgi:hypothetical protein